MIKQMQKETPLATRRKIMNLILIECCNCFSGECVASDTYCAQIQRLKLLNKKKPASLLACQWFIDAVLPLDKDLHAMLLAPQGLIRCERCNTPFAAGSNRAKYCGSCAEIVRKKSKRECAQKRRANL